VYSIASYVFNFNNLNRIGKMITFRQSSFKEINNDDPEFIMTDGLLVTPRANIEVTADCPKMWATIIMMAYEKGYLKVTAHVPHEEYFMQNLQGIVPVDKKSK
jgi:hypothetical protein